MAMSDYILNKVIDDPPSALAEALARLWASASPNAQSGRSAAPRPVTSRSRWPYMAKMIPFNIQVMHKPESSDEKAVEIDV